MRGVLARLLLLAVLLGVLVESAPTRFPTKLRTTKPPTRRPTAMATPLPTKRPTVATTSPTKRPTTPLPTKRPTTKRPTTSSPSKRLSTANTTSPTKRPTTPLPTKRPTTHPTKRPTTSSPSKRPTTASPTVEDTTPIWDKDETFPPTTFVKPFPYTKFCNQCAYTVRSSRLVIQSKGLSIFTPDASQSYKAQWTRDFASLLHFAPNLTLSQFPLDVIKSAVRITFAGYSQYEFPDRVDLLLQAILAPGSKGGFTHRCLDNNLFAAIMLASVYGMSEDRDLFCALEPQVQQALQRMPFSANSGLLYNDPAAPACTYGFMDTVVLTGNPLFVNVLLYDAAKQMHAATTKAQCGDSRFYAKLGAGVRLGVDSLYDNSTGYYFSCSEGCVNRMPDLWGSAYLVHVGLGSKSTRVGVLDSFVRDQNQVFYKGHLRHLPLGMYWKQLFTPVDKDSYQNGGYWSRFSVPLFRPTLTRDAATPMGWLGRALLRYGYGDLARELLLQMNNVVVNKDSPEWITRAETRIGVLGYVNSCSNLYTMLCE